MECLTLKMDKENGDFYGSECRWINRATFVILVNLYKIFIFRQAFGSNVSMRLAESFEIVSKLRFSHFCKNVSVLFVP